jgi:uncharacterized SAM-binding protein YcdF (DUF218 family)
VLRRALLVLCLLVIAWVVACLVLFVWPPARTDDPGHADAIVVLSGDKQRLPKALELARAGVAPVLVLSSVAHTPYVEPRRLCAAGRYRTVRVDCFEAVPYSTRGEARVMARLARQHGWDRLVVVSSTFHLTRAKMLFQRCYDGELAMVGSSIPWWRQPVVWASETGKLAVQLTAERGC